MIKAILTNLRALFYKKKHMRIESEMIIDMRNRMNPVVIEIFERRGENI